MGDPKIGKSLFHDSQVIHYPSSFSLSSPLSPPCLPLSSPSRIINFIIIIIIPTHSLLASLISSPLSLLILAYYYHNHHYYYFSLSPSLFSPSRIIIIIIAFIIVPSLLDSLISSPPSLRALAYYYYYYYDYCYHSLSPCLSHLLITIISSFLFGLSHLFASPTSSTHSHIMLVHTTLDLIALSTLARSYPQWGRKALANLAPPSGAQRQTPPIQEAICTKIAEPCCYYGSECRGSPTPRGAQQL